MPILVEYPQNLTLKPGETAWFACKTYDSHHAKVEWYFLNGTNPHDIDSEDLSTFKRMTNHKTVSFLFEIICINLII